MSDTDRINDVEGAALASYAISVNTLRLLRKKGLISSDEAAEQIVGALHALEQSGLVEQAAANAARQLLLGLASEFGFHPKKPN